MQLSCLAVRPPCAFVRSLYTVIGQSLSSSACSLIQELHRLEPTQTFSSKRSAFAFKINLTLIVEQFHFCLLSNCISFCFVLPNAFCALRALSVFCLANLNSRSLQLGRVLQLQTLSLHCMRTFAHFAKACSACENLQTESVLLQLLVREFH